MTIQLKEQVAIVTGAGGGLGRCHALELAKRGAKVVVNDLGGAMDGSGGSSDAALQVVEEIRSAGGQAIANGASVTDPAGVAQLVEQTLSEFGRIDVLVNNAGILRDKSFAKMDMADFQTVIDVHLMGSVYCTKAVWPVMVDQGYGRIVMTTSPSGLYGNYGQTNYGAAKLGLVGFMNTLCIEGAKYNLKVNAISPVAATRMTENLMPGEVLEKLGPELITPGVVFLCSEDAPTGAILQAAGGTFSVAKIVESPAVNLGVDASADDVAANWEDISDLSDAAPRVK
ncbi:SDR family oxidoreductase [Aurantivibrio plasticivorans]